MAESSDEQAAELRAAVVALRGQLAALNAFDAETQAALEQLVLEILLALHRADPGPHPPKSLLDRLQAATQEFEDSYPTLFRFRPTAAGRCASKAGPCP